MMDICKGNIEQSFYKLRHWKSKTSNTVYVFVGKEPQHQAILKNIEKQKPLTQENKETLRKTFGKNYASKLAINEKNIRYIFERINNDDTIGVLRKKLLLYIFDNASDGDIHLWAKRTLQPSMHFSQQIAKNIMKNKLTVSWDIVADSLNTYLVNANVIKPAKKEHFDFNSLTDYIHKISIKTISEPLGKRYMDMSFQHYLCPNPFLNPKGDRKTYDILWEDTNLIDYYNIDSKTIDVVLYNDIPDKMKNLYFPKYIQNEERADYSGIKTVDDIHHEVLAKSMAIKNEDVNLECYISFLHLRVISGSTSVNIKNLFEQLHVNEDMPFIKYSSLGTSLFKVDRGSLGKKINKERKIEKTDFEQWIDMKEVRVTGVDTLNIKVYYGTELGKDIYFNVIIFADGKIDIKYSGTTLSFVNINKSLKYVNETLRQLQKMIGKYIPSLSLEHFLKSGCDDEVTLVNMVMSTHITCIKSKTKLKEMTSLSKKLYPYVSVIEEVNSGNQLFLQYKRVNNYSKADNILMFLARNREMSIEDTIKALKTTFNLDNEEAQREYEKWREMEQMGKKVFFKPRYASFLNIKVRQSSNVGFKVWIEGVNDIRYINRVLFLLKFMIYYGDNKQLGVLKINAKDVKIYEQLLENDVAHEKEAQNLEFDDLDDLLGDLDMNNLNNVAPGIRQNAVAMNDDIGDMFADLKQDVVPNANAPANALDNARDNALDNADVDEGDVSRYVINRLQLADQKLFHASVYSEACQQHDFRQPIVISDDDKVRIDNIYPNSYHNCLRYGSDKQKAAKNIYICPEVWCPKSRISMTHEQYVKNGKKCPNPDIEETAMDFSTGYWADKPDRYVSFVKKSKHPDGLCMPCCFANKPTKTSMTGKRISACMDGKLSTTCQHAENKDNLSPPKPPKSPKENLANDKYIVGNQYPLENQRYGILPPQVAGLFPKNKCGAGMINDKTDCFLRKGIPAGKQYFFGALENVFDIKQDLTTLLIKHMTPQLFLNLNEGTLCKMFINAKYTIYDGHEFAAFRKRFCSDLAFMKDYREMYKLHHVREGLLTFKGTRFSDKVLHYKEVLREYMIYNAFTNFMEYLKSDVEKPHDLFIDIINRDMPWLNSKGYNVIVIETDEKSAFITCPFSSISIRLSRPFVILIKQGRFYEPMYHVKQKEGIVYSIKTFNYNDDNISLLVDFYKKNCKMRAVKTKGSNAIAIFKYLNTIGRKVKYQIITQDFMLYGFLLSNNIMVPCRPQNPMLFPSSKFIYTSDMIKYVSGVPYKEAKDVLEKVLQLTKDAAFYKITEKIKGKTGAVSGLKLKSGIVVPLDISSIPQERYLDNFNIFIGYEEPDERKEYIETVEEKAKAFSDLYMEFLKIASKSKKWAEEIKFLQHPMNPFPKTYRREKIKELLKSVVVVANEPHNKKEPAKKFCSDIGRKEECVGKCMWKTNIKDGKELGGKCRIFVPKRHIDEFAYKLCDSILDGNVSAKVLAKTQFKLAPNEIMFDFNDVANGKIQKIFLLLDNPYLYIDHATDEIIDTILKEDAKLPDKISIKDILSDELEPLPIKWNKVLSDYKISYYTNYDLEFLMKLAIIVNKLLNPSMRLNVKLVKTILVNKLINDYKKNAEGLTAHLMRNPQFKFMTKNIKSLGLTEIIQTIVADNYNMSEYELWAIAELLRINIVILSRTTTRFPFTPCIKPVNVTDYYLLLHWENKEMVFDGKKVNYDKYDLVVREKDKKFIFKENDLPAEFVGYATDNVNAVPKDNKKKELCVKYYMSV